MAFQKQLFAGLITGLARRMRPHDQTLDFASHAMRPPLVFSSKQALTFSSPSA
jgi:hypothetical protein